MLRHIATITFEDLLMITILGHDDYKGKEKKALLNKIAQDVAKGITSEPGDETYFQDLERSASDLTSKHNLKADAFTKVEYRTCWDADCNETLVLATGQMSIAGMMEHLESQGVISQ